MTDSYDYGPEHESIPQSTQLAQLSQLVEKMVEAEDRVADIEEELRKAKSIVRSYSQGLIPELMAQIGVNTITTSSGVTIALKTIYRASPKATDRNTAWNWLEQNGHGGLLKRTMSVSFAKGEEEQAAELRDKLEQEYSSVKEEHSVHSSTLKAWAKEMIESGKQFPQSLFGVEVIEEAKVKRPT